MNVTTLEISSEASSLPRFEDEIPMDGQEAYAAPKSENLPYASDVLQWFSGAEPIYDAASGLKHCRILGEEEEEEDYGGCGILQPAAKKRRLGADQIKFLERSFDEDNKLEPERKLQLAKDLGLQPRQVAVWFQNRRARSRTKNLEKEYGALKSRFDSLRADQERLLAEKSRLEKEVMCLKEKLLIGETEKQEAVHAMKPEELSGKLLSESKAEEAASSVRSGVFDSDSPYFAEADRRAWLEPADSSSRVLEGDDISLPELEESASIFAAQDQHFWSWPY